jgi:hypothetical protein
MGREREEETDGLEWGATCMARTPRGAVGEVGHGWSQARVGHLARQRLHARARGQAARGRRPRGWGPRVSGGEGEESLAAAAAG